MSAKSAGTISNSYIPSRGDIAWMVLDPVRGHEQARRRPVLVVSDKRFNERTSLAVICPITSRAKGLPFEITLATESTKGAILTIHTRSVDWATRKMKFIEKADPGILTTCIDQIAEILQIGSEE